MRNRLQSILLALCAVVVLSGCAGQPKAPWTPLFDGKSLSGWHNMNGEAKYEVRDGAIVGIATLNTPNTFLCTEKSYSDFILEFEFMGETALNSGVMFRAQAFPEYRNSRVHGYQSELDPSDRKWTAGIFDEARRGWIHPVTDPTAQEAYKHGEWNTIRIEAIGDTIKTFVNGISVAHLVDDRDQSGFFGLQVHGIGSNKELAGSECSWRNINILTTDLAKYATKSTLPAVNTVNTLTTNEKKSGWKLLFDGKTSKGWRGAKLEGFPTSGWKIEDEILTIYESGGGESEDAGDIVTLDKYKNFELCVDFRITEGANSGIKYYVDTEINKGGGSSIGLEYQILDDKRHPDAKKGSHEGSRCLSCLYDLIKAKNVHPKPIGEWNTAHLISKDGKVQHWLNGQKVLEYDRFSPEFAKLVSESKYKKWDGFGLLEEGQILLQDHGNTVSYKNVKIKELK